MIRAFHPKPDGKLHKLCDIYTQNDVCDTNQDAPIRTLSHRVEKFSRKQTDTHIEEKQQLNGMRLK